MPGTILDIKVNVGDTVNAFIYIDSEGRKAATLVPPKAKVNEVAYLKVVAHTKIGSFIDIGLQKDILVPFKAKTYDLEKGHRYLFYIYLQKSFRLFFYLQNNTECVIIMIRKKLIGFQATCKKQKDK